MHNSSAAALRPNLPVSDSTRWIQLAVGVICMVATANIQYAWTLFVPEIEESYGWSRASIQVAFTLFVIVQTWLAPLEGYFIDRFGPRLMVAFGAVFIGLAWVINSQATPAWPASTSVRQSAVSAWGRSTRPVSTMRSSGSRIGAASPLA